MLRAAFADWIYYVCISKYLYNKTYIDMSSKIITLPAWSLFFKENVKINSPL